MSMVIKQVPAGVFKQGCLALLDEVAEGNFEVVVTKRGRPVARIVAIQAPREQEARVAATLTAHRQAEEERQRAEEGASLTAEREEERQAAEEAARRAEQEAQRQAEEVRREEIRTI